MKILCIDGGGIRGYFAGYLLQRIQQESGLVYSDHFDLICGTSTGSIIAAALAVNYPLDNVVKLYVENGREIFKSQKFNCMGAIKAKYDSAPLVRELKKAFGDSTLSEAKTRLLIPSTDIVNAQVHVFKSPYLDSFVRDKDVKISDAVLASCSAPTYFKPAYVDPYLLADGGLWANDPSLVAYIEAVGKLKASQESVKILSVGTGIGNKYYSASAKDRSWGAFTGWGGPEIIDLILNLQSKTAGNMLGLLLGDDQYLRLNFERSTKLSLDGMETLADLKIIADRLFTKKSEDIRSFLEL
jgi:patatin-like phospholipase/acyl hydrolase